MAFEVEGLSLFHVARDMPYNPHSRLETGQSITIGDGSNPFFGFYNAPRTYRLELSSGEALQIPSIAFLEGIKAETINCPELPTVALDVARHFLNLARELIMEEVRLSIDPDAPSRKSCLWASRTEEGARHWLNRLGGAGRILHIRATGTVCDVDAGFLLSDSEAIDLTYENARRYWRGEVAERSEPETLFSGNATVVGVL